MGSTARLGRFEIYPGIVLGKGGFGEVFRAKDKEATPAVVCAAKQIRLGNANTRERELQDHQKEADVLRELGAHPSFLKLYDCITTEATHADRRLANSFWLFMEIADGGELFDRLIDSGSLPETVARPYLTCILEGLKYMHGLGMAHRDIKLENVMLSASDPSLAKIIDLGLAVKSAAADGTPQPQRLFDMVGSKSYRAPEVLSRRGYMGAQVDVWAFGIVAFSLVAGFFPLDEARDADWRYKKLREDQERGIGACESIYSMYQRQCPFSRPFRDLVDSMLTIDPASRATVDVMMTNPWFAAEFEKREKRAQNSSNGDDDNDGPVYRSLGGLEDELDEAAMPAFNPPTNALMPTRQKAARFAEDELPA